LNLCPLARYRVLAAGPLAMDETEGVVLTAANLTGGLGLTAVGPTKCVASTAVDPMGVVVLVVVVPTGGGDWGPGRVTATSSLP